VKEKYKQWKELMTNPRYKALAKLAAWFIFFVLLIFISFLIATFTNINQPIINDDPPLEPIESFINMKNFEYKYEITYQLAYDEETTIIIEGIFFDEKYYFNIGDQEYYADDYVFLVNRTERTLTEVDTEELQIVRELLSIKNIHNWITKATLEEEVSYREGITISNYFFSSEEGIGIPIIVQTEKIHITSISLNLAKFLSTEESQYEVYNVELTLTNINNITNFMRNFSEFAIHKLGE